MVGWLRARRIPIGLSLILLAFLVASGEILGSATSECQVEREPTLVALFVANTGGLTFYGQQLRSDCYIVVTYLMPNQSRYTLPGGYSSYFEAYVVIIGGCIPQLMVTSWSVTTYWPIAMLRLATPAIFWHE